jgi:hypothetical protein
MQLQVSVEPLTRFQGPERFYWPFAPDISQERLDLKDSCLPYSEKKDDV